MAADRCLPAERAAYVVTLTAVEFLVPIREITSSARTRELVRPRHVAAYLLVRGLGMSLPAAGRALCRHHTSILHAVRQIEAGMQKDGRLRASVQRLLSILATQTLAPCFSAAEA